MSEFNNKPLLDAIYKALQDEALEYIGSYVPVGLAIRVAENLEQQGVRIGTANYKYEAREILEEYSSFYSEMDVECLAKRLKNIC